MLGGSVGRFFVFFLGGILDVVFIYVVVFEVSVLIILVDDIGSVIFWFEVGGNWFGRDILFFFVIFLIIFFVVVLEIVELDVIFVEFLLVFGVLFLLMVEICSEFVFEVDWVNEVFVFEIDDVGNILVGSGFLFLRERLFGCLGLFEVGLMLVGGGGGIWEIGGVWSVRFEKKKEIWVFV